MDNLELYHHGILGMKWGVIRYQNKDGSLTPAGIKRRAKLESKLNKFSVKKDETEEQKKAKIEDKKNEVIKSRSAKQLYDNADLFTTSELQSAYNRLQLEKNIKSLQPTEVSKGKKFVDGAIESGKKVSEALSVGTKLYNQMALLYNTFNKKGEKLPLAKGDGAAKQTKNVIDEAVKDAEKKAAKQEAKAEKKAAKQEKKEAEAFDSIKNATSKKTSEKVYEGEVIDSSFSKKTSEQRETAKSVIDAEWREVSTDELATQKSITAGKNYIAGLLEPPKDKDD